MENKAQSEIITTVLIILLVLTAIVIVWQVVKYSVKDNQTDKDNDYYTSKYIKELYPEYKNCSVEYGDTCPKCMGYVYGANVYCDKLPENRDGLRIKRSEDPTVRIEFKDITLEEIKSYYKLGGGN